jgi:hypothetical protein
MTTNWSVLHDVMNTVDVVVDVFVTFLSVAIFLESLRILRAKNMSMSESWAVQRTKKITHVLEFWEFFRIFSRVFQLRKTVFLIFLGVICHFGRFLDRGNFFRSFFGIYPAFFRNF